MDILSKYTDAELNAHPWNLTKTQIYKLRKGMMQLSDINLHLKSRMMEFYSAFGTSQGKPDYNNPDYTHPSFESYSVSFRERAKAVGLDTAYHQWMHSPACGCVGPQGGAPFCPCQMTSLTAKRYATMQISPTEEGKALLEEINKAEG